MKPARKKPAAAKPAGPRPLGTRQPRQVEMITRGNGEVRYRDVPAAEQALNAKLKGAGRP